jgi:hypothetical protein
MQWTADGEKLTAWWPLWKVVDHFLVTDFHRSYPGNLQPTRVEIEAARAKKSWKEAAS